MISLVVQRGTAVTNHNDIEGLHQDSGIHRVAEGNVEMLPQLGGQEDVLIAVTTPAGIVSQVGGRKGRELCGVAWVLLVGRVVGEASSNAAGRDPADHAYPRNRA